MTSGGTTYEKIFKASRDIDKIYDNANGVHSISSK